LIKVLTKQRLAKPFTLAEYQINSTDKYQAIYRVGGYTQKIGVYFVLHYSQQDCIVAKYKT